MHIHQKGWNEKSNDVNALLTRYDSSNTDSVQIPVDIRVGKTWHFGNGASITPEVHAAWIYEAANANDELQMGFIGSSDSTTIYGVNNGRHRGLVGAGVKANFNSYVDAFVDYNFEFRSGYQNHNVMAGVGVSF